MIPLLPFAAGLIAGGLAVRLLRDESARAGLEKARETLRSATDAGLEKIKSSTAAVKRRFSPEAGEAAPAAPAAPLAATKKAAPRRKKAAAADDAPAADAPAAARKTATAKKRVRKAAADDTQKRPEAQA